MAPSDAPAQETEQTAQDAAIARDDSQEDGFWGRTLRSMRGMWHDLSSSLESTAISPDLDERSRETLVRRMQACIDAEGGEVSARARAAQLGEVYLDLSPEGKRRFLETIADRFGPDLARIDAEIARYQALPVEEKVAGRAALDASLAAPWTELLRQFNAIPQGVKFLVDLRADLLPHIRQSAQLQALDHDLQSLLANWFDIGFLEMHRITWQSPAALLEKLIAYEAVHEIRSWTDLRNRLDSDRRLFAFFHPRMPMEPLIFVEVALVNGIASSIQELLDEDAPIVDPASADTAIFYSISNTQAGLRGISFGNFLIKRVVEELKGEFANLKAFSTLSPVPGFRRWIARRADDAETTVLTEDERKAIRKQTGRDLDDQGFVDLLDTLDWDRDTETVAALKPALMRLCAQYLIIEKRRNLPADPVARFHLSNGAQLERINWDGDTSAKGRSEAAGIMVNYLYKLSDIERNHERFARDGSVTASSAVRNLAK